MTTGVTRHGGLLGTLAWNLQPLLESPIRIEENANGRVFVVRAEVAGIEPKDMSVTVADGELKIEVQRPERYPDCQHSEFRYGHFTRTVRLPRGAKEDEISAVCGAGLLEITVGLEQASPIGRTVPVMAGDDAAPPPGHVLPAARASGHRTADLEVDHVDATTRTGHRRGGRIRSRARRA